VASVSRVCSFLLAPALGAAQEKPQPPEVAVVQPVSRMITDQEIMAGRLESTAAVEIRPRVTGYLEKIFVKEGSLVRRGEILFEIDSRPLMALVDTARAQVAVSEASFRQAKASSDRMTALAKVGGAVTQQEVDKARADESVAVANLVVAKTALDSAQIQLGFTRVVSPIDGQVGRRTLAPGNLVKADETLLTTVVSRDPIVFRVEMPEATVLRLFRDGKNMNELPLAIGFVGEDGFPRKATIDFVDNQVDPKKKTLLVGGPVEKADGLLPGMSVRARLALGAPRQALLIPSKAVGFRLTGGQKEAFVLLVKENTLIDRPIEVEAVHGAMVAVKSGLKADDRVVLDRLPARSLGLTVRPRLVPAE